MIRFLLILIVLATPIWAVEPDEILADPVMEARARVISKGLRCLVCRNENIDSSNAGIAKDLRVLVRERLVTGDTNDQVVAHIVDRYGEYVLLKPQFRVGNFVPWLIGPILLLLGLFMAVKFITRPRQEPVTALSQDEKKRLRDLLGE